MKQGAAVQAGLLIGDAAAWAEAIASVVHFVVLEGFYFANGNGPSNGSVNGQSGPRRSSFG